MNRFMSSMIIGAVILLMSNTLVTAASQAEPPSLSRLNGRSFGHSGSLGLCHVRSGNT